MSTLHFVASRHTVYYFRCFSHIVKQREKTTNVPTVGEHLIVHRKILICKIIYHRMQQFPADLFLNVQNSFAGEHLKHQQQHSVV